MGAIKRFLGGIRSKPDPKDYRYKTVHAESGTVRRQSMLLWDQIPPAFHQGNIGSCGPHSYVAFMCFLFPDIVEERGIFSRLQAYYNVRFLESTINEDAGVQTRDLFKAGCIWGLGFERDWPYEVDKRFTGL